MRDLVIMNASTYDGLGNPASHGAPVVNGDGLDLRGRSPGVGRS